MLRQAVEEIGMNVMAPASADREATAPGRRPRVVILGAGFGGLNAAIGLRKADVDVTVVDRRNYHLFQPLLYQVATAGLSPAQIAMPIRHVLKHQKNATVLMEKVENIDKDSRAVITGSRGVPYDYLVIATGARHAYFGRDDWEETAPGLKTIGDATEIRARILTALGFEALATTELRLKPGVVELLDCLDQLDMPRCIATSSTHATVQSHLSAHDLADRILRVEEEDWRRGRTEHRSANLDDILRVAGLEPEHDRQLLALAA